VLRRVTLIRQSGRNTLSKRIGEIRSGRGNPAKVGELEEVEAASKSAKADLAALEICEKELEELVYATARGIPNRTHPAVPVGDEVRMIFSFEYNPCNIASHCNVCRPLPVISDSARTVVLFLFVNWV
jgi:seryl-tRNA synthetase